MRYSIIMPYYDRPEMLYALSSFLQLYITTHDDDYEVVVVEDSKNNMDKDMHERLYDIAAGYEKHVRVYLDPLPSYNSANKYNVGVTMARGDIIILTNPETVHLTHILSYLDTCDFTNKYYVMDCANINIIDTPKGIQYELLEWYQSPQINRQYHFCGAISKDNYYKAGGFPLILTGGIAYEDDFFLARVKQAGVEVISVHDQCVGHINHPRLYRLHPEEKQRLYNINQALWIEANERGVF